MTLTGSCADLCNQWFLKIPEQFCSQDYPAGGAAAASVIRSPKAAPAAMRP